MLRTLVLLTVGVLAVFSGGCNREKQPEADPNWKTSENPSDIVIPPQMMKTKPGAKQ
jgi:hypothetical protein